MPRFACLLSSIAAAFALASAAHAAGTVGMSLPGDFPVIVDASLGMPVLGFGAAGAVTRTPVIFLHGNNDTPFPTACNPVYGRVQAFAQYFADHGYATSELWALGYEGDQCDLPADQTHRSAVPHTVAANVSDLARFVHAVLDYTGAKQVDVVAHSLGSPLLREWVRDEPGAQRLVRRFVAVDGANHGIINCSPSPANFYQLPAFGGFTPDSAVCRELGSPETPFLQRLNHAYETRGSTRTLVIRNADTSFVYFSAQDGVLPPVPAIDSFGNPTDFSHSASLEGADEIDLTGQGAFDPLLGTSHVGILNSAATWAATFEFLTAASPRR